MVDDSDGDSEHRETDEAPPGRQIPNEDVRGDDSERDEDRNDTDGGVDETPATDSRRAGTDDTEEQRSETATDVVRETVPGESGTQEDDGDGTAGTGADPEANATTDHDGAGADRTRSTDETDLKDVRGSVSELRHRIDDLEERVEDYQRRNEREHERLEKYAVEDLAREMLRVKENLRKAIEMEDLTEDTERRLRLVDRQFEQALTAGRVNRIDPDREFDERRHRMVDKVKTDSHDPGEVVRVLQVGYEVADRVLRPAEVVVATDPEEQ